jgi:arylsulfatase A-like enzyme
MNRWDPERPAAPARRCPWAVAWLILLPLAAWLVLAKGAKVMNGFAWLGLTLDGESPAAIAHWLWAFTSLRFIGALLVGLVVQRVFFRGRRWIALPIAAAIVFALACAASLSKSGETLWQILTHWTSTAGQQFWMLLACVWSDAITIAVLLLAFGMLLTATPSRRRPWMVRALQLLVVVLCGLVAFDFVYELATGQPTNSRVLIFSLFNAKDIGVMVEAETNGFRVAVLAAAVLSAAGWAWWHRSLAFVELRLRSLPSLAALATALAAASAMLFPAPAVGFTELERQTEGTLIGLARTVAPSASNEIRDKVFQAYEATKQSRWHSAGMKLVATDRTQRKNVVIVMMESMRAVSTTLHSPRLPTTPFLDELAHKGLMVEDMNAVIPRTAAAWLAVLSGQYPLTNEGTAIWAAENARQVRLRGLPGALRDVGYATSFFTPTHTNLMNDAELIQALGFESVFTEPDMRGADTRRVNYFGVADENMVEPVLEWTAAQQKAGRPFMTAIMTNVGHHAYETPESWKKVEFEGVSDPVLASYYNCLRYIDHVMASLMKGYERLGLLDDTIFVFVGDHGQMFGEHGLRQTFNAIYEEGVHVPGIVYAPGLLKQPRRVQGPRQQIDIVPTVIDLLGYRLDNASLPGVSLLQPADPGRTLYFSSSIEWTFLAVRHGERKYVYSFDRYPVEVFDLAADPSESHALPKVDAKELAAARQEMIEWKVHTELSLYGRPDQTYRPARAWVER